MARFSTLLAVVAAVAQLTAASALPERHSHEKRARRFRNGKFMGWPGYRFPLDPWGDVVGKESTLESSSIVIPTGVAGIGAAPTDTVVYETASPSTTIPFPSSTVLPTAAFPATIIRNSSSISSAVSSTRVSTLSASPSTSTRVRTTSSASSAPPPPPPSSSSEAPAPSSTPVRQTSTRSRAPTSSAAPQPSSSAVQEPVPVSVSVAQTPSSGGSTAQSDINAYLSAHNTIRAQHGAAPLTWNQELANKAQGWANKCVFKHSGGSLGPFGENLAAGTGSGYGIPQAIKSWTDEVSEYSSANPVPSHFTQVVWKGTTQVGCAVQDCDGIFSASFGKAHFYVCEYSPQGNIIGQFAQNVQA